MPAFPYRSPSQVSLEPINVIFTMANLKSDSFMDFDRLLERLATGEIIPEQEVMPILIQLMQVLYTESNVLRLFSPIVICGDIHGQLEDLLELFKVSGDMKQQKYLFLGDYVDRGYYSMNTFLYLVCLKLKSPDRFFLLRGNHESRQVSQMYGFYNECLLKYGHSGIWNMCNEAFDLLPVAALIDKDVFCVHGGISPDLPLIEMISLEKRRNELPPRGALCDLCWSDPDDTCRRWTLNQRGAGYIFGREEAKTFCRNNNIKLIARSHQLVMEGYQWYFQEATDNPANPKGTCVTVWSAPNYAYRNNNNASIMKLRFSETGDPYELTVFKAATERLSDPNEMQGASFYFL